MSHWGREGGGAFETLTIDLCMFRLYGHELPQAALVSASVKAVRALGPGAWSCAVLWTQQRSLFQCSHVKVTKQDVVRCSWAGLDWPIAAETLQLMLIGKFIKPHRPKWLVEVTLLPAKAETHLHLAGWQVLMSSPAPFYIEYFRRFGLCPATPLAW